MQHNALMTYNLMRRDEAQLFIERQAIACRRQSAFALACKRHHCGGQLSSQPSSTLALIDNNHVDGRAGVIKRRDESRTHDVIARKSDHPLAQRPYHLPVFSPVRPAIGTRQSQRPIQMTSFERRESDRFLLH